MSQLAHIADRVLNRPLLLLPEKAAIIVGVLSGRIGVEAPEASRFEGAPAPRKDASGQVNGIEPFMLSGSTGIITITGSLVNRGAWIGAYSGLTSYEGIQFQLKRALNQPDVRSVILDLHSPGGEAVGAFETAALVRQLAAKKPVTAIVNGMAASAAYAIASGATEIVVTETGMAGSIGVVMMHADYSKYLENEGINPTLIFAGAHKVDGHPFGPLPDSVKADIQAEIDAFYEAFLKTVAAGRGKTLTVDAARATQARTYIGQAAVDAGLADRVGSFESVLTDLSRAAGRNSLQKGQPMENPNGAPAAEANAGITQAQLDAAVGTARAEGKVEADAAIKAERDRVAKLDSYATKYAGNAKALEIITKAKADGTSAEATAVALIDAGVTVQAAVLNAIQQDDKGASAAAPAAPGNAAPAASTPDGWKAEWEASKDLQAAYPKVEHYVAFKKADANGQVRILGSRAA